MRALVARGRSCPSLRVFFTDLPSCPSWLTKSQQPCAKPPRLCYSCCKDSGGNCVPSLEGFVVHFARHRLCSRCSTGTETGRKENFSGYVHLCAPGSSQDRIPEKDWWGRQHCLRRGQLNTRWLATLHARQRAGKSRHRYRNIFQ